MSTALGDSVAVELKSDPIGAAALLRRGRFDQAPVRDRNHVVGWVLTAALEGARKVTSVMHPLRDSGIVSVEASIAGVLELLASERFVFTVSEVGLAGFVTPSDLDRHAVRSHFYLLIADAEMALADIVRRAVPEDRVVERIEGEARDRWKAAAADNKEADAVEYLYLRDLAELFLESAWGVAVSPALRNTLTELCQLRPIVMHAARQLTTGHDPAGLASLARRGETLARTLDGVVAQATGRSRWK